MTYRNPKNPDGTYKQWALNKHKKLRERHHQDPDAAWARLLKSRYNLTVGEWQTMFIKQEGRCAICFTHQSEMRRRLNVDHDHRTGTIRGLLCCNCNQAIGLMFDSGERLRAAAHYPDTANQSA